MSLLGRGRALDTAVLFSGSAAKRYANAVLATSPIAFWKLNEGSGSTIVDSSGNGYNGTYTGVTWDGTLSPVNEPVPYWDGVNDYGDVYSAGLSSAIDLNEGFMQIWVKVDSAFWTDGLNHYLFSFWADVNNRVQLIKTSTNNTLQARRVGGGTSQGAAIGSLSYTDWFSFAMSWSVTGDALKAYINGVQVGTTKTGLATASGPLLSTASQIGSLNTSPSTPHAGYLANPTLWNKPADADMIALVATS